MQSQILLNRIAVDMHCWRGIKRGVAEERRIAEKEFLRKARLFGDSRSKIVVDDSMETIDKFCFMEIEKQTNIQVH